MPTIYNRHFINEPECAEGFYEAIGRSVVLWGRLEELISFTLIRIITHPYATYQRPDGVPRSFSRKMKLWRDLFKEEPLVEKYRPRALRFSELAMPIAKRRNELVHSAIGQFDPSALPGAETERLREKRPHFTFQKDRILLSDLEHLLEQIVMLYNFAGPIAFHCHLYAVVAERELKASQSLASEST